LVVAVSLLLDICELYSPVFSLIKFFEARGQKRKFLWYIVVLSAFYWFISLSSFYLYRYFYFLLVYEFISFLLVYSGF